jgi:tetratricopeptide (TPR) repeat protein
VVDGPEIEVVRVCRSAFKSEQFMAASSPSAPSPDAAGGLRAKLTQIREIEKSQGFPDAERAIVELIRAGEQSHHAFLALARVLIKQKKHDDALRAATKARTLAPMEAEPLVAIGLVSLRLEDTERAAQAFAEALRIDPNSSRANLGAAAVKMAAESYDDALELCGRVLELDPTQERAHELQARINMKRGRSDLAIEELRALVDRNPDNRRTTRAYLRLMHSEGRGDEMLDYLRADAEANPDDKRRQNFFARIAMRVGQPGIAAQQYGEKIDSGSAKMGDRVRYVMALVEAGEIEKAQELLVDLKGQRALEPITALINGDIALKLGDAELAVRHYDAACRAANLPPLDAAEAEAATDPLDLARIWRTHTARLVTAARRQRRGNAA